MVSKVMWVGRATVFVVGLAVIVALLFGVATTALGANGDFFKVGRSNSASAVSVLDKRGTGPALRLEVGNGKPLAVDSSARVDNLNADRVDGKAYQRAHAGRDLRGRARGKHRTPYAPPSPRRHIPCTTGTFR